MNAFSAMLQINISLGQLDGFGWYLATQEEAKRLKIALGAAGITSRESIIQFMATVAHKSYFGKTVIEEGKDAYWEAKGYDRYTRGAGYILLTHADNHRAFLDYMGDSFSCKDTATYIAENYALEASVWFWRVIELYSYRGVNDL